VGDLGFSYSVGERRELDRKKKEKVCTNNNNSLVPVVRTVEKRGKVIRPAFTRGTETEDSTSSGLDPQKDTRQRVTMLSGRKTREEN